MITAAALDPEALPEVLGKVEPALAPPLPAKSKLREYEAAAKALHIKPMPHQLIAARYLQAVGADGRWLWPEVAVVCSRQNGKTETLLPLIKARLEAGRRLLHTAQNRTLPREVFVRLAEYYDGREGTAEVRYANGQEVIRLAKGGRYSLVAPRPSARGYGVDDVIIDEVREAHDFALVAAIRPTLTASTSPQIIYLSNAGDVESVVLNDLRRRAESSRRLAYLEWSARADRGADELEGWREANPALGRTIRLETLLDEYLSLPRAVFETEHLCRWVLSMQPRLVGEQQFLQLREELSRPVRPALAVSLDAGGTRAAAALAWRQSDGTVALRELAAVSGEPIDVDRLGADLHKAALRAGVVLSGYDDLTDRALAAYLQGSSKAKRTHSVIGKEWANACELFVRLVQAGQLRHDGCANVAGDLEYAARRPIGEGAWVAVKASEDRPIPSLLAAVRAVWLASGPALTGRPTIR
jgi:hypothetical protein